MRKKFGQNFLINPAVRIKLLDALEFLPGAEVWEIGPGLGAMTQGLLERGAQLTAFEIDPAFIEILKELFGTNTAFRLVEGDVLKTWHKESVSQTSQSLLGNLPYNIAAALIGDFIEKGRFFSRMVVTVQEEVAQRMIAKPGSKDYSSFSVLCSSVYKVLLLQKIKSAHFYPAPNVDSRGVRLDLLPMQEKRSKHFYPLVRSLFSLRRKTLRNSLTTFASSVIIKAPDCPARLKDTAEEIFIETGISGDRRPETLDIHEFAALAACLEDMANGPGN
jgi:16S rRNA (adenine1518-N6/adenine1519-N6)-dimethyltransferase